MADWSQIVAAAKELPGVTEAVSYREPSLKVRTQLLTRLRVADQSIVLLSIDPDERTVLIAHEPGLFFVEPHYIGYPAMLARLSAITVDRVFPLIVRRWRAIAPKRAVKAYDTR